MLSFVYAFVCYLLVAIVVTYPLIFSLDMSVGDPVDAILNTWILAFEHHTLLTQPLEFFNTNIFYPHARTLLFSETLLLPSLLLLPIRLTTGSALLTHNFLVLMGFTLTGTSGYLLGRWLFHSFWPAMVVGGVLAFNSYTLSNTGQAQLLHLEWLPLALLYMAKLLHKPTLRFSLLAAFFLAAQFYSVIYYGIFSFLVVGLAAGVGWLFWSFPSLRARLQSAGAMALGIITALVLCLPLGLAYYAINETYGFERQLSETLPYSASVETWTTALEGNLLYGQWLGRELPKLGFYPLDALFPGVLLLCLAAAGVVMGLGRTWGALPSPDSPVRGKLLRWPLLLLFGIILFFVLSFGPYPQFKSLQPNFEVLLPYAWIHDWIPGFPALRAPVRFAAIVFLGLAIAAAYSLRFVRWRAARAGLFLLLLIEILLAPSNSLYTPETGEDQRAAYRWLATMPPTVYLELPIYRFGEEGEEAHWLESQFQSINHWQATPVGYSGFFPPRYEELTQFLSGFTRAEAVSLLQAMGVEWILLHRERLTEVEWLEVETAIRDNGWRAQQWGDVWAVHLPKLAVEPPEQQFFIPDVAQAGGMMAIGTILLSAKPIPLVPASELGQVRVEWWRGDQQILAANKVVQPPYFVDAVATSNFTMAVPQQPDLYQLKVFSGEPRHEVASGMVNVLDDIAPPEVTLLPVRGVEANVVCEGDALRVDVLMQTTGWYDEAFTLSGRVMDGDGVEVARSAADVEFPAIAPRRNYLNQEYYSLPFDSLPQSNDGSLSLELHAYQWQQSAERVVARNFVTGDGTIASPLRLPLTFSPSCRE